MKGLVASIQATLAYNDAFYDRHPLLEAMLWGASSMLPLFQTLSLIFLYSKNTLSVKAFERSMYVSLPFGFIAYIIHVYAWYMEDRNNWSKEAAIAQLLFSFLYFFRLFLCVCVVCVSSLLCGFVGLTHKNTLTHTHTYNACKRVNMQEIPLAFFFLFAWYFLCVCCSAPQTMRHFFLLRNFAQIATFLKT